MVRCVYSSDSQLVTAITLQCSNRVYVLTTGCVVGESPRRECLGA
jgi:hypothetical protein